MTIVKKNFGPSSQSLLKIQILIGLIGVLMDINLMVRHVHKFNKLLEFWMINLKKIGIHRWFWN